MNSALIAVQSHNDRGVGALIVKCISLSVHTMNLC